MSAEIIVAPLALVEELTEQEKPAYLLSVIGEEYVPPTPASLPADCHIKLAMHDIAEDEFGMQAPKMEDAERIIALAKEWDQSAPLLVHCFAGVSRSGAAALMTLVALNPGKEKEAAELMRERGAHAWPNSKLIADADHLLNCEGRLIQAVKEMGPANLAKQGRPYRLPAQLP